MFDLLLDRRAFFRSESHNPRHLLGIRSCSTYELPLVVPRKLFQSEYLSPSVLTGQGRVLGPSMQPTSPQTRHLSDSSYSLRRPRMFPLMRRTHRYLPCVRMLL